MKKCILLGMSLMFIALCIGLTSCGKDGEEDEITGGTDGTVASYFIGKWKQSDVDQVWTFNADGTCVKDYTGHYNFHDEGTWHYVPETKTLITDIDSWIWVIISTSDNQWTGMTVNGKKAYTYNRVNK